MEQKSCSTQRNSFLMRIYKAVQKKNLDDCQSSDRQKHQLDALRTIKSAEPPQFFANQDQNLNIIFLWLKDNLLIVFKIYHIVANACQCGRNFLLENAVFWCNRYFVKFYLLAPTDIHVFDYPTHQFIRFKNVLVSIVLST